MANRPAPTITIPHEWEPYPHQERFWEALMVRNVKRIVIVWHRRAGKDLTMLNALVCKMMQKVGVYWYVFPTYRQGRDVVWNGMTNDGRRFLDAIPKALIKRKRDDMMSVELVNGSQLFIKGSDRIDTLVGANPIGVVFSEYSIQNPQAWNLIRPILNANEGWAVFVYTPRGYNHGYDLFNFATKKMAVQPERWHAELLTVDDTSRPLKDENGNIVKDDDGNEIWVRLVTDEMIQEDIEGGMPSEVAEQEYRCSFDAALVGAYYGEQMKRARVEGRITTVPYDESRVVHTGWDLGISDAMAVWYFHLDKEGNPEFIDHDEYVGQSLKDVAKEVLQKPYVYGTHLAPHDIKQRELTTGQSRLETAKGYGIKFEVVPKLSIADGIDAARRLINKSRFDQEKCSHGISCLCQYSKTYDPERKVYSDKPKHDWTSHSADGFRMIAVGIKRVKNASNAAGRKRTAESDYDLYTHESSRRKGRRPSTAVADYDPLELDYS